MKNKQKGVSGKKLGQQLLKRYTLKQMVEQSPLEKKRFCLQMCCVGAQSEAKLDKNGQPFRSTRVFDGMGMVTNVMVWGGLAQKEHVWDRDAVIDIFGAESTVDDKRLTLRSFSQVRLAANASSFKRPARLLFLDWNESTQ